MRGTLNVIAAARAAVQASAGDSADIGQSASVQPIPIFLGSQQATIAGGTSPTNVVITLAQGVTGTGTSGTVFDDEFSSAPWRTHRTWQAGDTWSFGQNVGTNTDGLSEAGNTWWSNPVATPQAATVYPAPSGGILSLGLMTTPAGIGISQGFIGTLINNQLGGGLRLFGYHEMRVKMPNTRGFLFHWDIEDFPTNSQWTVEIDLDLWTDSGGVPHVQCSFSGMFPQTIVYQSTSLDITQFHIYGLNWQADFITFYIDGVQVGRLPNPGGDYQTQPCFAYFLTNDATGIVGDGSPTAASLPTFAQIDYYRVYSNLPTVSGTVLVHGYNAGGTANTITDSIGQTWLQHPDARIGSAPKITAMASNLRTMPAGSTITVGFTNPGTNTAATAAAWFVPYVNSAAFGSLVNVGSTAGGAVPDAPTISVGAIGSTTIQVLVTLPTTGAALDAGLIQVQYRVANTTTYSSVATPPLYITPTIGSFTDPRGHTWTIGPDEKIYIDGVVDPPTGNVLMMILMSDGTVWQVNASGDWYSTVETAPGGTWNFFGPTSPLISQGITATGLTVNTYDFSCYVTNAAGTSPLAVVQQGTIAGGGGGNPGGTGPAASGTFSADFTSLTGRTAVPQLFGMATGGLGNALGNGGIQGSNPNPFADVAQFPLLRQRVKDLNLPLIRLHSGWIPGGGQDTFSPNYLVNLVSNVANLWSTSTTVILGIACRTLNGTTFQNFTRDAINYWKANAPAGYKIHFVEAMNEVDSLSASTYADCWNGMVTGAQQADPTIKGTGPASAGYVFGTGQLGAIINGNTFARFGFGNHHQYMYCGGDPLPSDQQSMLSTGGANVGTIIAGMINDPTIGNTYARNSPAYGIFETNMICGGPGENRTQTNIGAGFMASTILKSAQTTTWTQAWMAFWDLYYDTDSNYNMIFPNAGFTLGAQYYTLQNLIRCMPGAMVSTTSGFGNVLVFATKSNANFGMTLINGDNSSHTGNIGLSHWPVNDTGNAQVTMWQLDGGNYSSGGVTTHPTASAGVLSGVTLTPMSVTVISSP